MSCSVFPQCWQHRLLAQFWILAEQLFGKSSGLNTRKWCQCAGNPRPCGYIHDSIGNYITVFAYLTILGTAWQADEFQYLRHSDASHAHIQSNT